jgi:hypothetical protein
MFVGKCSHLLYPDSAREDKAYPVVIVALVPED